MSRRHQAAPDRRRRGRGLGAARCTRPPRGPGRAGGAGCARRRAWRSTPTDDSRGRDRSTPHMDATNLADLYGLPLVDWERVEARLRGRPLAGTGAARPPELAGDHERRRQPAPDRHRPAVGVGLLLLHLGRVTRKARNLARDPRCTLGVSTEEFDLAVDGDAAVVTEPDVVADLAARFAAGGWPAGVDDSGVALTAEFSAPSAGPPPWQVYRLTPRRGDGGARPPSPVARPGGASDPRAQQGSVALADGGAQVLVELGDHVERDLLGAGGGALADVGAAAEALVVVLARPC